MLSLFLIVYTYLSEVLRSRRINNTSSLSQLQGHGRVVLRSLIPLSDPKATRDEGQHGGKNKDSTIVKKHIYKNESTRFPSLKQCPSSVEALGYSLSLALFNVLPLRR